MKHFLKITLLLLFSQCTNKPVDQMLIQEKLKNSIEINSNIPTDIIKLDSLICQKVKEISYTTLEEQDSVYVYDIFSQDSSYVGTFNIIPLSLSKEKNAKHRYWALRSSCSIGELAKNDLIWKDYSIEVSCGFHSKDLVDKDLVDHFYDFFKNEKIN